MLLNKETMSLLGLANRAGKVKTGSLVLEEVRKKRCYLVLIAKDASEPTKKTLIDKCTYYSIEYILVDNSELLSKAIGKTNRKSVAIMDLGFADGIKKKLGQVM